MHRQARLPENFDQIAQNTLFWNLVQNIPPPPPAPSPPKIEIGTDLATLGFDG